MNKLFFDLESTGKNPYTSEIITGSFHLYDDDKKIDVYNFSSQVNNWSESAAEIHGISHATMMKMPSKSLALDNLCEWLSDAGDFDAVIYANPLTELGFIYYDIALLQMELMNHLCVNNLFEQPFRPKNIISVHTMAKECAAKDYFTPIKGESGRKSFKQTNVYFALFEQKYNAHNANDDVEAMIKIYKEISRLNKNKSIKRDQLSLF